MKKISKKQTETIFINKFWKSFSLTNFGNLFHMQKSLYIYKLVYFVKETIFNLYKSKFIHFVFGNQFHFNLKVKIISINNC